MKNNMKLMPDENRDVTVLELLLNGADRETVISHCYEKLKPLIEADTAARAEYVYTLKSYIKYGNDLVHTSQNIYIHRNTCINRVKRINALLGQNVNDPLVRNEYQNIFQIMELYGEEV